MKKTCNADDMRRLLAAVDADGYPPDDNGGLIWQFFEEEPWNLPIQEGVPPELREMRVGSTPLARLIRCALNTAEWFDQYGPQAGIDFDGAVAALRTFAGRLAAIEPDPAQLAADMIDVYWIADRAYRAYMDWEDEQY